MNTDARLHALSFPLNLLGILLLLALCSPVCGADAKPAADPFGRESPRSAITNFLQSCHNNDYQRALQYFDLNQLPAKTRAEEGVEIAKKLQAILNSDSAFDILRLSQRPEGNLGDQSNPTIEHVATVTQNGRSFPIDLERVELKPGQPIWLLSPQSVAEIRGFRIDTTESAIEGWLPASLVKTRFLETALWKWIALAGLAILVVLIFRFAAYILMLVAAKLQNRSGTPRRWPWVEAILDPAVVVCAVVVFRIAEGFLNPSALARLYIGRVLILVVTASIAWGLVNFVDVFMNRFDSLLNSRHRIVSQSLIYLGRRFFKVLIVCLAALTILSNWGYDTTTILAGLGVGGIAVALAAQSTIANVFGGVSVIGDAPVTVGDFGKFGDVIGIVQDIGMRSTRIRTLNRTIVSIPNSSFAGINLENYSVRDKILFNPTLHIKRPTPKEQIRSAMSAIQDALSKKKMVELGPTPLRISGISGAFFALEVFAYVLTPDIDAYYKIEAELYLTIDDALTGAGVEVV